MSNNVTLEELKSDERYSSELIDALMEGNVSVLAKVPMTQRSDRAFMVPLLYAVKNRTGTYEVFRYCGEKIQSDPTVAIDVLRADPSLIEGTPLCNDPVFIKNTIGSCPEIAQYISYELKQNDKFTAEVFNETGIKIEPEVDYTGAIDAITVATLENILTDNPALRNDSKFMTDAIQKDPSFLELAAKELKDDFDFMREQSKKNERVIDIVVNKADEFNLDAIKAVRESSRELTVEDCMALVDQYIEKHDDPRYQKVKDKIQERGMEDPRTMKWITAMVAQMDDVSPDLMKKIVDYSMLTMEKTRRDLDQDGKMVMNMDVAQAMITPLMLRKLMTRAEEKGVALDENMHQAVDSYIEFYEDFRPQFVEYKRQLWEKEHPSQTPVQAVEQPAPEIDGNTSVDNEIDTDEHSAEVEGTEDTNFVALDGPEGIREALATVGLKAIDGVATEIIRDAKEIEGQTANVSPKKSITTTEERGI